MSKINWGRVILGGLVAGLIVNLSEFLLNAVILKDDWDKAMAALGRPAGDSAGQITFYLVYGFVIGIFALWLYAAIRPRYGAGPKTALGAGVAVWILGYLMATVGLMPMELFPARLMYIGLAVGLVEILLGTLAGAYFYKETPA
jgi:hypothetical protein